MLPQPLHVADLEAGAVQDRDQPADFGEFPVGEHVAGDERVRPEHRLARAGDAVVEQPPARAEQPEQPPDVPRESGTNRGRQATKSGWRVDQRRRSGSSASVDDLTTDITDVGVESGKLAKAVREFGGYLAANAPAIPNYGERRLAGEIISTSFVESAVNQVISKRMVKKQQMRWSPRRAHLLFQIRTRVLNDTIADDYRRWYPTSPTQPIKSTRPRSLPRFVPLSHRTSRPMCSEPDGARGSRPAVIPRDTGSPPVISQRRCGCGGEVS